MLLTFVAKSQINSTVKVDTTKEVWTRVDVLPEFKGGLWKFNRFVDKNLNYPLEERKNHVEGNVYVNFVVEKNGILSNLRVQKGLTPACDAEALRVMALSPPWTPGSAGGVACSVNYTLPIRFKL